MVSNPIIPLPTTTAVSPSRTGVRLTACTATPTASIIAACSKLRFSGSRYMIRRGTATNSANAPWRRYGPGETPSTSVVGQVLLSPQAIDTPPAVDRRIERPPVARPQVRDVGPGLHHLARRFVSHHQRWNPPPCAPVQPVDVAATDPASADPNQHVVRTDYRDRHLHHLQLHVLRQ